jgi:hypothetical protein
MGLNAYTAEEEHLFRDYFDHCLDMTANVTFIESLRFINLMLLSRFA